MEIHFPFQEVEDSSFLSTKLAFSNNLLNNQICEEDQICELEEYEEGTTLSEESLRITARAKSSAVPSTPATSQTSTKPVANDYRDTNINLYPEAPQNITRNIKSATVLKDTGTASTQNAKCGIYSKKDKDKYTSLKDLKNKIKGVEKEKNLIEKKTTEQVTIQSSDGNRVTKTFFDSETIGTCDEIKDSLEEALGLASQCEEELKKAQKAKTDFSKDCSQFSGKLFQCSSAIKACANCVDGVDHGGYDCVKIHNRTKCPALSGKELKAAKEKRDKATEEIEKFQEKVKDLEEEIISKENDLNEVLSELDEEFMEANRELERLVEEQKADMEHQLKKNKVQISKAVAESIAKVQAEIDNFLKVAHTFENAITKANMEYRKEKRQLISECEVQAQGRLSQYRKKRKALIKSGSLKISLSSLLQKGRTTFGQVDAFLIKKYYSQCLAKRKPDFQEIYNNRQQKLRVIEQQREQYQDQLNKARQRIADLNNQAAQEQNKQLKEYTAIMDKILANHQKEVHALNLKYFKSKQTLLAKTKAIDVLKKHRSEHSLILGEKQMELVHEQSLISYLKQMGVEEDGKESEFGQAASSYSDYEGAARIAYSSCSCESKGKGKFLFRKCSFMEKKFKILEDLDLEEEDDTIPKKDKTSFKPKSRHKKGSGGSN